MSLLRIGYWLLTSGLIGFGFIGILSIGLPFLLLGILLLVVGAIRLGSAGLWAAVIGFGGVPALILLWDVTSAPWACMSDSSVSSGVSSSATSQPNVNSYSCVDTFVGPLTTYHLLAFVLGAIALLGLAWPLFWSLVRRPVR